MMIFLSLRKRSKQKITMNKSLLLILIPCLVAFVMVQAQFGSPYGGYGGVGGYGSGIPQRYYNYAAQARQSSRTSNLLNIGKCL